jgi:hypothetical protein
LKNGNNKSYLKKQSYLLRNLLWVREKNQTLKMFGSTPSGSHKSYSYYITHTKLNGQTLRLRTEVLDEQIPKWLSGFTIDPEIIPIIREVYQTEIRSITGENKEGTLEQLKRQLTLLKEEEGNLGRIFMTNKISEETYDKLYAEWQEKALNLRMKIEEMEIDLSTYLDDLEVALVLLSNVSALYQRLDEKQKNNLLQILVKRIIINREGEIISHKLHPPFSYLSTLVDAFTRQNEEEVRSEYIHDGVQKPPESDPERFFSMIRFDSRQKLDDLQNFQLDS